MSYLLSVRNLHVRIYNDIHCSFFLPHTDSFTCKNSSSKARRINPRRRKSSALRRQEKRKRPVYLVPSSPCALLLFFACPLFNLLKFLRWAIKKAAKKMTGFRVRTYRVTTAPRIRTDNSAPSLNHRYVRFSPRLLSRLFILMFSFSFAKRVYMLYFSFLMVNK